MNSLPSSGYSLFEAPLILLVLQMINSKVNNTGLRSAGSGLPTNNMQSPIAIKKTALRDVQNGNRMLIYNHSKNIDAIEGRSSADTIKVSGTKRVAPECPARNHSLSRNGAIDHPMYAGGIFESEQGQRRIQGSRDRDIDCFQLRQFHDKQHDIPQQETQSREPNICSVPPFAPMPTSSLTTSTSGKPSVPVSLRKYGKGMKSSESNHIKVTSEVPHAIDTEGIDQQRKQRYFQLQQLLRHFDESDHSEHIQSKSLIL